jgi:hypothetical protein
MFLVVECRAYHRRTAVLTYRTAGSLRDASARHCSRISHSLRSFFLPLLTDTAASIPCGCLFCLPLALIGSCRLAARCAGYRTISYFSTRRMLASSYSPSCSGLSWPISYWLPCSCGLRRHCCGFVHMRFDWRRDDLVMEPRLSLRLIAFTTGNTSTQMFPPRYIIW